MAIFNSFLYVYQRVIYSNLISISPPLSAPLWEARYRPSQRQWRCLKAVQNWESPPFFSSWRWKNGKKIPASRHPNYQRSVIVAIQTNPTSTNATGKTGYVGYAHPSQNGNLHICVYIYIIINPYQWIDDHHPIRPNMGQFATAHHIQCSDYDDHLQLRQRWLFSRYPAKNHQQFHWLVYIVYCVYCVYTYIYIYDYPVIATETGWFSRDTARTCFLSFSSPGGCIFIQTSMRMENCVQSLAHWSNCTASAGWFTWFHIWMECKNNSHHHDNHNHNSSNKKL